MLLPILFEILNCRLGYNSVSDYVSKLCLVTTGRQARVRVLLSLCVCYICTVLCTLHFELRGIIHGLSFSSITTPGRLFLFVSGVVRRKNRQLVGHHASKVIS
jgi:hypothetical protein